MLSKIECHGFKFAVSFKIRFEVLKQNNFFTDGGRVVKECELVDLFNCCSLVLFVFNAVNVNKVEKIRRCHNFSAIVEKNPECT